MTPSISKAAMENLPYGNLSQVLDLSPKKGPGPCKASPDEMIRSGSLRIMCLSFLKLTGLGPQLSLQNPFTAAPRLLFE